MLDGGVSDWFLLLTALYGAFASAYFFMELDRDAKDQWPNQSRGRVKTPGLVKTSLPFDL